MKKHTIPALLAACGAILLPACTTSGTLYPEAKKSGILEPKKDKALVIVYMKPGFSAAAEQFKVYANDQLLSDKMRRPAFCTYDAAPGQIRLSASAFTASTNMGSDMARGAILGGGLGVWMAYMARKRDLAVINAGPLETYFAELTHSMKIRPVSKEKAEREIQKCHWVNPPTN